MIVSKKESGTICHGLSWREFKCKCNHPFCRATIISQDFIETYTRFREHVDVPLHINSGYRCALHNFDVDGMAMSKHLAGRAIDIHGDSLLNVYSTAQVKEMARQAGFQFVKWYTDKNFFHIHV